MGNTIKQSRQLGARLHRGKGKEDGHPSLLPKKKRKKPHIPPKDAERGNLLEGREAKQIVICQRGEDYNSSLAGRGKSKHQGLSGREGRKSVSEGEKKNLSRKNKCLCSEEPGRSLLRKKDDLLT